MLSRLGIQTRLQLAITVGVLGLIIVTTLGGSGGAPWVFFTYRTVLVLITLLTVIGSRNADLRIERFFLGGIGLFFALILAGVLEIPGSHFEGFYLWFKYAFFACAFLGLANYARYQSARWRGVLLGTIVVLNLAYLLPDLVLRHGQVAGFSQINANYFATFLLIGLAATVAAAAFATRGALRVSAAVAAALILFGIVKTSSRGATLAVIAMGCVAAVRARGRIPRSALLATALAMLIAAIISSPYLVQKFLDRGEIDPYNYARTEVWLSSLQVVAHHPVMGVGFGQFIHASKRFTLPMEGTVARYLKRAQMAHNEYIQHAAEFGIPAAILLFGSIGYMLNNVRKRAETAWPEYRCFHEAALLTVTAVGTHGLVDNCWTIPVTASALVVLALADPLPLEKIRETRRWKPLHLAFGSLAAAVYVFSIAIPALGLYYNDQGHKAYDRDDFSNAVHFHLAAIQLYPNHPIFLDNLGMVYLQKFTETHEPKLLDLARQYFARASEASPQALDPHIHMETVLLRSLSGDPENDRQIHREVIRVDTELLTIDPFIPFVRKNLALAYYSVGESDRAMKELAQAIDYEPNYVPAYLQMADWYGEHGDDAAKQRYTAAAFSVVNKYRNFKPTQAYESILLGRPEGSRAANTN